MDIKGFCINLFAALCHLSFSLNMSLAKPNLRMYCVFIKFFI